MKKNNQIYQSEFYCTKCGKRGIPLIRKPGGLREMGHLKKLYCLNCHEETNHAEIRPGGYSVEDFKQEFLLGRFVEGQRISIGELQDCQNESCKYNVNGKCWNANKTFVCEERKNKNG